VATPDQGRRRTWRFRLNDATTLEVSAPTPATEKQVRRRGRWSLILGTVIAAVALVAVSSAAVSTDQADYAPGSVVTIRGDNSNGAGYLAGETVSVAVSGPNSYQASCDAVPDDTGAWSCQVTLWDNELAEGEYTYVATGLTSGVSETGYFTDHGPSPVTDDNYSITANASHLISLSVDLGGGSSSVTLTAATMKVANVTDGGTTDIALTSPGTTTGNGSWTGSFQGACGKTYKINNVGVTWRTTHDHSSTEVPATGEGTDQVTTNACATANTAPTADAGNDVTGNEGSAIELDGSGSFDSDGTITYAWVIATTGIDSGGSCSFDDAIAQKPKVTCNDDSEDAPGGQFTATLTVTDDDGATDTDEVAVTVSNVAPTVTLSGTNDTSVFENATTEHTYNYTVNDAGTNDSIISRTTGCGSAGNKVNLSDSPALPFSANGTVASFKCVFPDGGPTPPGTDTTISATVTDDDGDAPASPATQTVNISNVAPTVVAEFTAVSVNCQTTATLTINPDDLGVNDSPWKVNIAWGDGNTEPEISRTNLDSFTVTHVYALAGGYNATVSVTDKDNATGSDLVNGLTVNQTYTVDFRPPFDDSNPSGLIVNKMKNGRVVPVKATIYDDCGQAYVTDPGADVTVKVSKTSGTGSGDPVEEYADAGESSAGTNEFRWTNDSSAPGGGFWIYNLDSKALGLVVNNLYRVDVYVGLVKATASNWAVLSPVK
jgi:hypothetical protein